MAKRVVLWLIGFYQGAISPRTPPSCFFYPTCSHYTYEAIERFGLWRGGWLGLWRICRCHPFTRGGYDPVPTDFVWISPPKVVQECVAQSVEPNDVRPNDVRPNDARPNGARSQEQVDSEQVGVPVVRAPKEVNE